MHVVVLGGGDLERSPRLDRVVLTADLVIAADSGARHAAALGLKIDIALGDFDSSHESDAAAARVLRFPVAKDETDLHLALREARRAGATAITLLGALRGPRLDHGVANIALLAGAEFRRLDVRALDGPDELRLVRGRTAIMGRAGDLVSILAWGSSAGPIQSIGLLYPLAGTRLRPGETRGVSNELTGERATVACERGVLLLVHRDGLDPNRLPVAGVTIS